ncbi:hypothetical protein GQ44DRAFT_605345 [Phaeosphaeriaceae sp. PMI808]|nr:hypothetical protein GQ44DRAFT_605345 [Phaeosphaeriaceae sp. PMI808]
MHTRSFSQSSSDSDSDSTNSTIIYDTNYTSCIQEAQLSPDGSCIFTSDYNRSFSVYAVDPNIQTSNSPHSLKPYAQFKSPDPIWAFAVNPLFNFQDANSTNVLISRRDRYITLHNALWNISQTSKTSSPVDISTLLTSYKLINPLTEAIIAPLSLTYSHTGTHFFASHQNAISIFDLQHTNPISSIRTIPSARNKLKGGGCGFKGHVSALTLSNPSTFSREGMLAAGARTRHIGIYDALSSDEITTFSLPGTIDGKRTRNENISHLMGDGVSYLRFSPCAKYLYVAERSADVLLIYDVRKFSVALAYCTERRALTKQKMGFDVWASAYEGEVVSHEVWAGGTDGRVRVWRDPCMKEGAVLPDEVVTVGEGDAPVVGTMVGASGGMAVAACGKMQMGDDGEVLKGRMGRDGRGPRYMEWGSLDILGLS